MKIMQHSITYFKGCGDQRWELGYWTSPIDLFSVGALLEPK